MYTILGWVLLGILVVHTSFADEGFVITHNAVKPKYRILLISNMGCKPCELLKQEVNTKLVENGYAKLFEYLDYESNPEAQKYAIARGGSVTFPQVIVTKIDGSIKAVHFGYTDGEDLGWFLYSAVPKQQTIKQVPTQYQRIYRR